MADILWGSREEFWGSLKRLWGAPTDVVEPDSDLAAYTISLEYPDETAYHVWTGFGDLSLGGIDYVGVGPDVISIGTQTAALTGQGRMSITLSAIEAEHRAKFLQDPGKVTVTVRILYSTNGGQSWAMLNRFHRGELSRPQLQGGNYTIEISPYRDTLDRGYEQSWSDELQKQVYPGDRGFEHLQRLSEGVDIRWP